MPTTLAAARPRPTIVCRDCRHRSGVGFRDLGGAELDFMTSFKEAHEAAWAGDVLIHQGEPTAFFATLYSGLAIKCRTLSGGTRQIVSVLMPGDLIGLETAYGLVPSHSVEAITDVTFCRFNPARLRALLNVPELASRILEINLADQRHLEDRFATVASCPAKVSLAHFVLELYDRLRRRRLMRGSGFALPLTNQQFAHALGLTTVHLHRVLRQMREDGVFTYDEHRIEILDLNRLRDIAGAPAVLDEVRPLI